MENEGRTTVSDDLAYMPATELAARIRRRDLSPVDLSPSRPGREWEFERLRPWQSAYARCAGRPLD